VVDDGSTDDTAAVVERAFLKDPRFRLVRQSCGGASVARNRGFMESLPVSKYVVFMDADDVWESFALESLVERLEASPSSVGAHALAEMIDKDGHPLKLGEFSSFGRRRLGYWEGRIAEWPLHEPSVFETLVWTGPLYPPGLLLARRVAYEAVGLYDPMLRHCEDWDMCLRLSRVGAIEFVNKVVLHYRRHGSNASNNLRATRAAVRKLHFKTFFSSENSSDQRATLRAGWRAWQRFKISEKWSRAKDGVRGCSPGALLRSLVDLPVHVLRYMRGYPSRSGL